MQNINDTKYIALFGEQWTLKALLSILTDSFKWDYTPPLSTLLVEAYKNLTVRVTYNDNEVQLKAPCNGTSCSVNDFLRML